jgi:hypothetical protein
MGNATIASTRNLKRHREYVIQYAMGMPTASKIPATQIASFKERKTACQFNAFSH